MDGLEVGGKPVGNGDDFDALLAQQVAKAHDEESPREAPTPRRDPSSDSAAEIVADVLNPEVSPSIRDGLSVRDPATKPEREAPEADWAETAEGREILKHGNEALAREKADAEELARLRFQERFVNAETAQEQLAALADLKTVSDEEYSAAVWELAAEIAGVDPDTDDPEDVEGVFSETLDEIQAEVERVGLEKQLAKTTQRVEELTRKQTAEDLAAIKSAVNSFARERRLQAADVARIERYAAEALGWDLGRAFAIDPAKGRELLEIAFGALREQTHVARERRFHEEFMDAPSTSVGSGLTQMTPFGEMALQPRALPSAELDAGRIARRSVVKRTTGADIRRGVAASESTSVKDGLTGPGGAKITLDEASGANRRHAEEEAARRARAQGFVLPR